MLCTSSKISVLYLSYTGILEPLGRSQVLAYLTRLSDKYSITLVSFEKPEDFANECAVVSLKAECDKFGIQWKPRRYHHRPRLPATVWDLIMLLVDTWKFSRGGRIQLIHCRSYIPTMAACIVGLFTRVPFVFDMRALWPEEMVTAGRLKKTSFTYRALNWTERQLLGRAASVVSLTSAAVVYLKDKYV
ncbi:glycosyltransferase, partial [bacterium]|nr:glycosyltransferase [bacterium]